MPYRNPIIPGTHPDPSLCRVGADYYLATSSFAYFPAAPIFHSRDLVNWRLMGHALNRPSQLPLAGVALAHGMYAPSLRHIQGRFYLVTTLLWHPTLGCRHLYVWADDPSGPWSEPVWIEQPGIDPDLFEDHDGRVYFLRNNANESGPRGLVMGEINLATGVIQGPMRMLWSGTGGYEPEGPHLYRIGDWYYLLAAENGTYYGHMATIARSRTLWGPYESCPRNPILTHRHLSPWPVKCTGHGDLFQAHDGSWWMVFLGVRPASGWAEHHHLGRETFLAPVTWSEDGWPVVNGGQPITLEMAAPTLPLQPWPPNPGKDDFTAPGLDPAWITLRQPPAGSWSLAARPGWLRLHGAAATLDDTGAAPVFVGRRQQQMNGRIAARLDFEPRREGEEAGLSTFMSETHHYEIAVASHGGQRVVRLRRRVADLQLVVAEEPLEAGPVTLICDATADHYLFSYALDDGHERRLGSAAIKPISAEAAGVFTGMILALYATGNGRAADTPADFDWVLQTFQ